MNESLSKKFGQPHNLTSGTGGPTSKQSRPTLDPKIAKHKFLGATKGNPIKGA